MGHVRNNGRVDRRIHGGPGVETKEEEITIRFC